MVKTVKKTKELKPTIQRQLIQRIGEVGYTAGQIHNMLNHLDHSLGEMYGEDKIRKYARKNNLAVDIDELGFQRRHKSAEGSKYYIPKSKLVQIIDGLDICVTVDDLEKAAARLGYQG